MNDARLMWTLYEPIHAVTYFTPESLAAFQEAGLKGFWRGYFAGRAAPLGEVGAAPVIAAFYTFAPAMVTRALPDVWRRATPERVLRARIDGSTAALARLLADQPADAVAEAADLLAAAAARVEPAGRVLGAANAALPVPGQPLARLWQAATTLREHRGDGHVAALVAAGVGPREALAWRAAYDMSRAVVQPARGWTDEEWDAAARRLTERGWLDADGRPTPTALAAHRDIEAATDRAAAAPWEAVDVDRVRVLLEPIAAACRAALPADTPIGLPTTGTAA
ncbi:SCO6745 family protein [Planosporangium sp. 12N6]|uniref:SCO6745 family protein n=1 Tax=Planosporangium spinosum TaxID=3402278 RepID=UPI003CE76F3C